MAHLWRTRGSTTASGHPFISPLQIDGVVCYEFISLGHAPYKMKSSEQDSESRNTEVAVGIPKKTTNTWSFLKLIYKNLKNPSHLLV